MKNLPILLFLSLTFLFSCTQNEPQTSNNKPETSALRTAVDSFLTAYTAEFQNLYYESAKAQWALNTKIVEGDTTAAHRSQMAEEAYSDFTGSGENIEAAQKFLEQKDELTEKQWRQLEAILYAAAGNPEIAKDIVSKKIAAENEQVQKLYGFPFQITSREVSTNDIDRILSESEDLQERLTAWRASKEVGVPLKDGLENLRELRNQTVQALGYEDYFDYQVSEYGMNSNQMVNLNHDLIRGIWPLYRELHTWARHELAEKYGEEVPEMLPAHWLPNRWGQSWESMVNVEGLNIDGALKAKGPEWIMTQGEDFYKSLGYQPLPETFYTKSSLYPLPANAGYKKNNHASAWHLDLENDVRSLMSVEPNTRWWNTVLHELGHIYYYQAYSTDSVPLLLRGGANRAYHEAIGTLIGLASLQKPFFGGARLGGRKPKSGFHPGIVERSTGLHRGDAVGPAA